MSNLLTFHKILPGCEEGSAKAWQAFLATYSPFALRIFEVYAPGTRQAHDEFWRSAVLDLAAEQYAALKGFSHQSEREFLVDLRAYLQDRTAGTPDGTQAAANVTPPSAQSLRELLNGLPVLHQEIAFLTLAGYSRNSLEKVLRITPDVAGNGLERLRANFAVALDRQEDRCLWPAAWGTICRAARAEAQKDCTPLRQLIRVLDGQASWYDKTPAETHRAQCLHCLELWTSLMEVVAWDRARQPWPDNEVKSLLALLPVKQEKARASFFGRIFGK